MVLGPLFGELWADAAERRSLSRRTCRATARIAVEAGVSSLSRARLSALPNWLAEPKGHQFRRRTVLRAAEAGWKIGGLFEWTVDRPQGPVPAASVQAHAGN